MAKGSTSEKSNKSANFHQFHPPNESFVKRVTNRVSELLPQPTTWLSKWLSTSQQSQEEREEEALRPPTKKRRVSPSINDYAHQNNIRQYEANTGEISPITHGRINDMAVAGPSGLHNPPPEPHFISSTPAVPSTKHSPPLTSKANGDDGSDSSDSTSGCSSLVPQADKPSNFSTKRIRLTSEETNTSPSSSSMSGRNLKRVFPQRKSTRMEDALYSSRAAPSFDLFTFQNSYRGGLPDRSVREEVTLSPFYKGRTMYGGASARCEESLETSFNSLSRRPTQVFNVKPPSQRSTETMGSTARKILDVLEKFSTPVLEAKKIPLKPNTRNIKRKLPQPYEELCIPQLPDLLRIKRREKELSVVESPKKEECPQPKPVAVEVEKKEKSPVPKMIDKPHVIGSSQGPGKEPIVDKAPSVPHFPPIQLPDPKSPQKPLPAAPSFSFVPKTKPATPPLKLDSAPKFSFTMSKPPEPPSSSFRFSSPITLSTNASIERSPVSTTFSFSAPLEATDDQMSKSKAKQEMTAPVFNFISSSSLSKLKRKDPVKATEEKPLVTSSVTDYFKAKKSEENISEKKVSDLKEFKLHSDQWECKTCLVRNSKDIDTCVACQSPKEDAKPKEQTPPQPLGQLFKNPLGSWECKECLVANKSSDSTCVACSTPKPGQEAKPPPVTPSLGAVFKKPEGSWECDVCMVQNKSDVTECVACNSLKPGAKPKAPEPKFTFGIPPADNKPSFSLEPKQNVPTFSFGVPQTEASKLGSSNSFTFGSNPSKKEEEVKLPPKNGGFTFIAPKQDEKEKKSDVPIEKTPMTTFGVPKKIENDTKLSFFPSNLDRVMMKFGGSDEKRESPKLFDFKPLKKDDPPSTSDSLFAVQGATPVNSTAQEKPGFEAPPKPLFSQPDKPLFEPSNDWRQKPLVSEPNPFSASSTPGFSFRPSTEAQQQQPTFTFNTQPPQTNSIFTFKAAEQPSESKPMFQFNAAGSQPRSTFQTGVFGASAQAAPVFGAQAPAASTFSFGATPQQPDQNQQQSGGPSVFTFNAQPAVGSSVTPFAFGSQNSSIGPPSGFNPPTSLFPPGVTADKQQRKIKKAIRRTTNLH